jgi:hypothetical protein
VIAGRGGALRETADNGSSRPGTANAQCDACTGGIQMSDLVSVLVTAAFFLLAGAYTRGCEKL